MTPLELVLSRLPGAKRKGDGWAAPCPVHCGESKDSLGIAEGDDGRVLLCCRRTDPCSAESIVAAIGLNLADLMPLNSNGVHRNGRTKVTPAAPKPKGKAYPTLEAAIAAAERSTGGTLAGQWEYPDAAGELVGVVARFNLPDGSKTFRPFHPDGDVWRFGDPPGKWPVYGKAGAGRTYHVEGERCCDAMLALGLPCITSAHGADGAGLTDWSGIRDVEIIALPDLDVKGESYVGKVAAILRGQGCKVRVVRLADVWRDLPEGGDIVDMLGDGGPWSAREDADIIAALNELADAAPEWMAKSNTATGCDDETPPALPERWIPRRLTDLADDDPVEYVIPGLLARRHVTILSARAKCGKTTWLAAMIRAMRDGLTFCGLPVEAGRVLLITEESFGLWKRRDEERAIGDHLRIMSRPFMLRPSMSEWGAFCRHVARLVEREGFAVVIVDTLGRVSPVESENDAAEVTGAMMPLAAIAEAGAAVLVVHHQRKGDGDAGDGVRGSGAFTANVDVVCEMRHFTATDRSDRRRTLNIVGRFSECPDDEIVVELGADGQYRALGNRAEAKARDKWAALDAILPTDPPGMTVDEMRAEWPEGEKAPGKSALFGTLQVGRDNGRYGASGTGKRNDPLRFYLRLPADSSTRVTPSVSLLDDSIGHPEIGGRIHSSIPESIGKDEWTKRSARQNGRAKPKTAVDETAGIVEGAIE